MEIHSSRNDQTTVYKYVTHLEAVGRVVHISRHVHIKCDTSAGRQVQLLDFMCAGVDHHKADDVASSWGKRSGHQGCAGRHEVPVELDGGHTATLAVDPAITLPGQVGILQGGS